MSEEIKFEKPGKNYKEAKIRIKFKEGYNLALDDVLKILNNKLCCGTCIVEHCDCIDSNHDSHYSKECAAVEYCVIEDFRLKIEGLKK